MPQFDIYEFSRLYIWFLFIFIYFYIFWSLYIIPQLFKSQMIRKFIFNDNNIYYLNNKIDLINSKNKLVSLIYVYKLSLFKFIIND
jgi:hypothetical protein